VVSPGTAPTGTQVERAIHRFHTAMVALRTTGTYAKQIDGGPELVAKVDSGD
jgi:hypothetical protein